MVTDLIIPVLNEAANLPGLLARLDSIRREGTIGRLIVADNGSSDGSPQIAQDLGALVVCQPQRGYGGACLAAWNHLLTLDRSEQPEAVAFLDADGSDDVPSLGALIAALEDHELAIGCRTRLADRGALNFVQRSGNRYAVWLMRLATGVRYHDLGPMRAIRFEAMRALDMRDRTWGWTVEMQMKAALLGWRVAQIDVPYHHRAAGRSKISGSLIGSIRAGTKITATIGALWWRRHSIQSIAGAGHAVS